MKNLFSKFVLGLSLIPLLINEQNSVSSISDCGDFVSGPSAWPHVLVATTISDGSASQASQTYTMNVTSYQRVEPMLGLIKLQLMEVPTSHQLIH